MSEALAPWFASHHHEALPSAIQRVYAALPRAERKEAFTRRLAELDITYLPGRPIPVSFLPRVLPRRYFAVIERCARDLTELMFASLCDPEFQRGPLEQPGINARLLRECRVLGHLPSRLVGSARYDFAVQGPLEEDNPPCLLEVNNLDYGGGGWIPNSHVALLEAVPELRPFVRHVDLPAAMGRNMLRLGPRILMVTMEDPDSCADYTLFRKDAQEKAGVLIDAIDDVSFAKGVREGSLGLGADGLRWNGRRYDALYPRLFGVPEELETYTDVVRALVTSRTPTYDSFGQLLLENKGLLGAYDRATCERLVGADRADLLSRVLIETRYLDDSLLARLRAGGQETHVLKKADGHLGKTVWLDEEIPAQAAQVTHPGEYCVQRRVRLNTVDIDPTGGAPARGIGDLGIYIAFEWDASRAGHDRLSHFEVAGLLTRSSPHIPKVNVSLGGCVVPVYVSAET